MVWNDRAMPTRTDQPIAIRATAFIGESRRLRRPVRRVRYDACWADGRVQFDVSLVSAMYRGSPADFAPLEDSVHKNCPEIGTGRWVNEFAQVVDGPSELDPNPPGPRGGRPRTHGVIRREPTPAVRRAWRLGVGVAGLGGGILLLTGPSTDGILGVVGVLCCLTGLAALAGRIPRRLRWW
jgi:hypothetical protein